MVGIFMIKAKIESDIHTQRENRDIPKKIPKTRKALVLDSLTPGDYRQM